MSLELDNHGLLVDARSERARSERTRSEGTREAGAPWPLLARLPHIESAANGRAPLPAFAAPPQRHDQPSPAFVERPHADARCHQPATRPTEHRTPAPSPAARRYRIDRGTDHIAAGRSYQAPAVAQASLADSVSRVHEALAPHRGFVSAAALILAASFVYWLAVGRQGGAMDPSDLLDFRSGLTQEAPADQAPPALVAPEPNASARNQPRIEEPPIDWSTPPRVANAPDPAPHTNPQASPLQRTGAPELTPTAAPTLPPAPPAEASTVTSPGDATSAALDNGITPTPETEPYPTTSFPAFSFVEQSPTNVAERPTLPTADAASAR